jgi:hypothetical protein
LRPKTGWLLFGQLVWRKMIFFQFFLLDEWTAYFTSFPWTPSTPNSDFVWAHGEFLLKTSIKLIFHVISKELLHAAMWLKLCPKAEGQGSQKIVCFAYEILVFHFFFIFFLLMVLHDVTFNVTVTIWMLSFWIFSRIFTRSIVLKFGVKTPINKENSSSLILTNLELKFEPCMLNLIWKWGAKDPQKKKTLTFECYNLLDPMEWGAVIFGGWCSIR